MLKSIKEHIGFKNLTGIKRQLVINFGLLIIIVSSILTLVSYFRSKDTVSKLTLNFMDQMSIQASKLVETQINKYITMGLELANNPALRDPNASMEEKTKRLQASMELNKHSNIGLADLKGDVTYLSGYKDNLKSRDYFQEALNGKPGISEPRKSTESNEIVISYAVPVKDFNNNIISVVVYNRPGNEISKAVQDIKFLNTGSAYMLDSDGVIIAHKKQEYVEQMKNFIEESKTNKDYKDIAEVQNKMIKGEKGIGYYEVGGIKTTIDYLPIDGMPWSLAVMVDDDDVLAPCDSLRNTLSGLAAIALIFSIVIIIIISTRISRNLKKVSEKIKIIATGDFTEEIDEDILRRNDEVGVIGNATNVLRKTISDLIVDIKEIGTTINSEAVNISSFSEELSSSTDNISLAISQVADGNTEQASNLGTVSEGFDGLSNKIEEANNYVNKVHENALGIQEQAKNSKVTVVEMEKSADGFSNQFDEFTLNIEKLGEDMNTVNSITNIIKGISDQTNLLALNAAIEAARAGEMGKGFAVVADEIRALAEQSKDSSEEIYKIIVESCKNTNVIVQKANNMNTELVEQKQKINHVSTVFDAITVSVDNVIPDIDNVYKGFNSVRENKDTISGNIQEVSAISEEISASSEEISASSQELNRSSSDMAQLAEGLTKKTDEIMDKLNNFKL